MSLKCPLSAMRMRVPCRSIVCNHNQCFDATSFLQLQEQAPQWSCPICNKFFTFEALAVDEYVKDILRRFPNVDQVTIEPDGTVGNIDEAEKNQRSSSPSGSSLKRAAEDDDDIIEITDNRSKTIKTELTQLPSPYSYATPSSQSRQPSTSASTAATTSGKRKQPEVVDLTEDTDDDSDDDPDDVTATSLNGAPPRQPFRGQSIGGSNSSFRNSVGSLPSFGPRASPNPLTLQLGRPNFSMPPPPPFPPTALPHRSSGWQFSPASAYTQYTQNSNPWRHDLG